MEENKDCNLKHGLKEKLDEFRTEFEVLLENLRECLEEEIENDEYKYKFKVGDVITGKNNKDYGITNNESVLLVTEIIDREHIKVKVISHKEMPAEVGQYYQVMEKHFKLITDIL